jgi:DNA topoisomerase-3
MKLIIAEKPSLAAAIRAAAVGNEYTVTNVFGHMYEQAEPDHYLSADVPLNAKGKKKWRTQDLPIVPVTWVMNARADGKTQLAKIKELLKTADEVINAGDPDREGQLLIDELLAEMKYKGPVKRLWLPSLTIEGIKKSFSQMKPNSVYKPLSDSAMARSHADWLVGMNLTRAWTLKSGSLISVGRVQSPTLALIVRRDLAIENFKPSDYFDMQAKISHGQGQFMAKWRPVSTDVAGFDENGRLVSKQVAASLIAKSGDAKITEYTSTPKKRVAPLPYNLAALTKVGSSKYGMSAKAVLDAAQELYDGGYTSYPRTNCQYLGMDQHGTVGRVAEGLSKQFGVKTDANLKHAAFNDKEVTAHTAIVPTGKDASRLCPGNATKLYELIAKSVVAMFVAPEEYLAVAVTVDVGGENFVATGKQVTSAGWTAIYGKEDQDEDAVQEPVLPLMKVGDFATATVNAKATKTKPPRRFTEGTLIIAMEKVYSYVEDPAARAKLKETSGIGTDATRVNIVETLKKRDWTRAEGKNIISTADGRAVIAALPPELTDPVTTALWEDQLSLIEAGTLPRARFEAEIVEFVKKQIVAAANSTIDRAAQAKSQGGSVTQGTPPPAAVKTKCPKCNKGQITADARTLSCQCGFKLWREIAGLRLTDAQCETLLATGALPTTPGFLGKNSKPFSTGLKLAADLSGKVEFVYEVRPPASTDGAGAAKALAAAAVNPCPKCKKPMRQRTGAKGPFWGCSGYPDCKVTATDNNGKIGKITGYT